jgi:tRNA 5-methylaminomethyl-2-thiouridine biosynthesis bifunctional protein
MNIPPHLINEHYNDRYFDVVNAIEEAKQVYFQGNNILEFLTNNRSLSIGETGFGSGRILVALMDFLDYSDIHDITITYNSVELHPINHLRMNSILDEFRTKVGPLIDLLVDAYSHFNLSKPGWQQLQLKRPFGIINLNLWLGEALEMVHDLKTPCDAWFLDGHGPKKNPAIWRPELLMEIGKKTRINGTCATYTVAGDVKRALIAAGFSLEKVAGCGGKKSVLKGVQLVNYYSSD